MANVVKVKVNLGGIAEKLRDIEPKISRKLLRKSLTAVGTKWVEEVKSRVPVLEGDLKQSIVSKVRTRKATEASQGLPTGSVEVGPGYGTPRSDGKRSVPPAIYGMWVEFGVASKKYQKEPFLRPTFDATANDMVSLFAETLKSGLADALKDD